METRVFQLFRSELNGLPKFKFVDCTVLEIIGRSSYFLDLSKGLHRTGVCQVQQDPAFKKVHFKKMRH